MAKEVSWHDNELAKRIDLGSFSKIVVNDYERALLVKEGEIQNVFKPGKYSVTKFEIRNNPSAIYINLRPFKLRIGVGDVLSEDDVNVGCYGTVRLAVDDANMFYTQVLGGNDHYTKEQLDDYIESNVQAFLRTQIANYEAKELYKKNDVFVPKLRSKLSGFFDDLGIDFKDVNIQGINLPKEIKDAMQSRKSQEIKLEKEEKRMEVDEKRERKKDERMVQKYRKLKEAGIDVSEFKEKEIAEKDPEVLIEKYRAEQDDGEDSSDEGYCVECGEKLQPGAQYCHNCGAEVPD